MWMAITPYPGGDANYENPSIFSSTDGREWKIPAGLINPVATSVGGYNSDPDLVFDSLGQQLLLYYREVLKSQNLVKLSRSNDGVHWSSAVQLIAAPSHELVSPTVVHGAPDAAWQMWSVNAGPAGCGAPTTSVERRTSFDGVTWGPPQRTNLAVEGGNIWHIDVNWLPTRREYWALFNVYPGAGNCATRWLFLATSPDGVNWTTYPSPVLARGVIDEFQDVVYRSSFAYDPQTDFVTFWFSGARYHMRTGKYRWYGAVQERRVTDLLSAIQRPPAPLTVRSWEPLLPPPEPADTLK
jgi:hypothetical protein